MADSRQGAFEKAKLAREAERKEKAEKDKRIASGTGFDYEQIAYVGLELGKDHVVRLLGNPKLARDGDPFSSKEVFTSMIMGDNDKQFRCIWPSKEENPNWILWKIFDLVTSGTWVETNVVLPNGKKKKEKRFNYSEKHPSIFYRATKNNKTDNAYEKGWTPEKYTVMNVIDRHDMAWHKENKHTKLLSKKGTLSKDGTQTWYDVGIPDKLHDLIWDDIVEKAGWWEDYDIAITKCNGDPWYKAYHAEKDDWKIQEDVKKYIVKGLLTEEEKTWERYNIDSRFKITSFYKIQKNLGTFIEQVDKVFGKNFTKELNDFVEIEKAEWEKNQPKTENNSIPTASTDNGKKEDQPPAKRTATVQSSPKTFDVNSLDQNIYKGLKLNNDTVKKQIIGIESDGSFIYEDKTKQVYQCTDEKCNFLAPGGFSHCPKCGIELPPIEG